MPTKNEQRFSVSNEMLAVLLGAVIALHCWEVTKISDLQTHVAVLESWQHLHVASNKP